MRMEVTVLKNNIAILIAIVFTTLFCSISCRESSKKQETLNAKLNSKDVFDNTKVCKRLLEITNAKELEIFFVRNGMDYLTAMKKKQQVNFSDSLKNRKADFLLQNEYSNRHNYKLIILHIEKKNELQLYKSVIIPSMMILEFEIDSNYNITSSHFLEY